MTFISLNANCQCFSVLPCDIRHLPTAKIVAVLLFKFNVMEPKAINKSRAQVSKQEIRDAINQDKSVAANAIISIRRGKVILRGSVETPQQKAKVTAIVSKLPGVIEIENLMEIDWMC